MAPQQAFSWSASWSSWVTIGDGKKDEDYEHNNLVKVEAFPRSKEMLRSEKQENFPVLIQVTAPPVSGGTARAGVDVVAVLDVSGSMEGERLEHVKEAMEIFIGKLGPDDRLSVVSFATSVRRLTELTYMSEQGRAVAKEIVDGLVADGSTNMGAALREGAMILRDREGATRDESNGRVGCMMFLSDGTNDEIYKEEISGEFPAHTFGLGSDHNPNVMRYIADETSATYSFVNRNIADIKGAFDLFISGLTSVVATAVRVTVRAHAGAAVSSIRSGGYAHRVAADRLSGAIDIHDMYAGERKCFVVYLTVAEGGGGKKRLLTVGGSYRRSSDVMSSQLMLRDVEVSVVRPRWWCSAAGLAIHGEVAAELARIKMEDGVAAIVDHPTGAGLQEVWSGVMASAAGVPEATMSQLRDDVGEMMKGIEDPDEHKKLGLPYMLSWLTCHRWQRATTKNSPSNTDSFQRLPDRQPGATPTTPWTPWWKTMTATRWSRYALMCGGFLLAAAFLYFAVAGVVLMLGPSLPAINHRNGNGNVTMDITRQAGWAKMEHDLQAVITTAKSDGETGSLFRRAASSDWSIDGEIDRYLYMAIVYATVLRSQRRGSTGVISEKVVRREVERYLRRMPKAMEVVEIPSFEDTTMEQTKNGMNRYLYSTIVQTNIKEDETAPTPPNQLDDTRPGLGSVSKPKPKPETQPEPEPEPYMVIRIWRWMTSTTQTSWSRTTSTASIAWSSSKHLLLQIFNPSTPTPTRISELEEQNLLLEQNLRKEQATSSTLSEKLHELEQRLKERMDEAATAERRLQEQAILLRQQVEEREKAVARLRSEAAASAARLEACVEKEARSGGCCERVRKLEAVVRELRG